jgi:hypothetical protein
MAEFLVEADTADAVHEAANRAAVPFERVLATAGHTNHETKENDMSTTEAIALDLEAVKERQQTMWASGDFHAVAALIQPVAEDLCEAVDLRADWRVLDVATGSGNAALAAARLRRRRHRLRPGAPRPGTPSGGGRRARHRPRRGRRRVHPVPGREL